MIYNPTMKIK